MITTRNTKVGAFGATISTLALLVLVIGIMLLPGSIDDGAIRGGLMLVGALLPIWFALFLYFFCVSFKRTKKLKFALLVQTMWILILSLSLGKLVFDREGWVFAIAISGVSFITLSVVIGVGSWACARPK